MIVANMATYPKRSTTLMTAVHTIAPQVDLLNVVLNEYETVPPEISGIANVKAIIPEHDTKDAGKFYPDAAGADFVFYVDDDVIYPEDFVKKSIHSVEATKVQHFLAGYHCSIYYKPVFSLKYKELKRFARFYISPHYIARFRKIIHFGIDLNAPIYVDQVATNAALMRGADAPPYEYMKDSQKFVDVRLAKWAWEKDIARICLPRRAGWLQTSDVDESIMETFTLRHFPHVGREILTFAFKGNNIGEKI